MRAARTSVEAWYATPHPAIAVSKAKAKTSRTVMALNFVIIGFGSQRRRTDQLCNSVRILPDSRPRRFSLTRMGFKIGQMCGINARRAGRVESAAPRRPLSNENVDWKAAVVDENSHFSHRKRATGALRIVQRMRPDCMDVAEVALNRIVEKNRAPAARLEHQVNRVNADPHRVGRIPSEPRPSFHADLASFGRQPHHLREGVEHPAARSVHFRRRLCEPHLRERVFGNQLTVVSRAALTHAAPPGIKRPNSCADGG